MTEIWGAVIVFIISPMIGAIPLVDWFTYAVSGKELKKLGTGNVSIAASFYYGGKLAGSLALLSEMGKGIAVVLMTRAFFPMGSPWEIMALIALVMGVYWAGREGNLTSVTWGIIAHNPMAGLLIVLLGSVSFTIFRTNQGGKIGFLGLMVVVLSAQNINSPEYLFVTIALASLLLWIFDQLPDNSPFQLLSFFRGDSGVISLSDKLTPEKVGSKAANLSLLKQWGYSVPDGWVIKAGDDLDTFCDFANPSVQNSLVVRPCALDKDSLTVSAAGIYASYLNITDGATLKQRIIDCLSSYHSQVALNYRQNRDTEEKSLVVIVQKQIIGQFSGVAFSRNPINQLDDCICIEAVAQSTHEISPHRVTPEQYRVYLTDEILQGRGNIPPWILFSVAKIAREIEKAAQNIPQDIEWTYDGENIWVLQNRPISTLYPLWTRTLVKDFFPKALSPLSWSINHLLMSGVSRNLLTVIVGDKVKGLDFDDIVISHYNYAYFNASFCSEHSLLMGLCLDDFAEGKNINFSPFFILKNISSLWSFINHEWALGTNFNNKGDRTFNPLLDELEEIQPDELNNKELLTRINHILEVLRDAQYLNTLAYLGYKISQQIFNINSHDLNHHNRDEIYSIQALKQVAIDTRNLFSGIQLQEIDPNNYASFFATLSELNDGESVIKRLDKWLETYGYLSDNINDISIPRWSESHRTMKTMFTSFVADKSLNDIAQKQKKLSIKQKIIQNRYTLYSSIKTINNKLFAHLRKTFLSIGNKLYQEKILAYKNDIFLLKLNEIETLLTKIEQDKNIIALTNKRQQKLKEHQNLKTIPNLIYGNSPKININNNISPKTSQNQLQGIPASMGIIEGKVKIIHSIRHNIQIDKKTIIIAPYIDASWSLIIPQAGGIITEIGGQLSHGAILAREYQIPAVMNIPQATRILRNNQPIRLDGQKGIVEIL
ncbi:glycerol-3-phosphate acyltransferase [Cyanobacterium stanieri LEGE 03274]|uniref:Glycerol-3-phosphate acyltransferase n=1 Tax=Cyanobacterium stanieri LEGE 03274 TaxID=1828756 RepID=A0ABR9V6Q3_9CHRO|nr:glycerol-3-phosphate acyltransferase [Cyanobacterium stanieri]MBE9223587.1 glycerol-3-phosphate acyltransferase [Cyanobacterium stanieri LEGE 03274]